MTEPTLVAELLLRSLAAGSLAMLVALVTRGWRARDRSDALAAAAAVLAAMAAWSAWQMVPAEWFASSTELTQPAAAPLPAEEGLSGMTDLAPVIAVRPPEPGLAERIADWAPLAALFYTMGVALLLARLANDMVHLRRIARASRPLAEPRWQAALAQLTAGCGRPIRLRISDSVSGPASFGWLRPHIVVPSTSARDTGRAVAILAHELAHIRNRDWLRLVLLRVAVAFNWFNPIAWWLYRQQVMAAELAADDEAVRLVDTADYAATLVDAARRMKGDLKMSNAMSRNLKSRIERLVDYAPRGARPKLALGLSCAVLAAGSPLAAAKLKVLERIAPAAEQVAAVVAPRAPAAAHAPTPPAPRLAPGAPLPLAVAAPEAPAPPAPASAAFAPRPAPAFPGAPAVFGRVPAPPAPPAPPVKRLAQSDTESEVAAALERAERSREEAMAKARIKYREAMQKGARKMQAGAVKMREGAVEMETAARRLRDPAYREQQIAKAAREGRTVTHEELLAMIPDLEEGARDMREGADDMEEGARDMAMREM